MRRLDQHRAAACETAGILWDRIIRNIMNNLDEAAESDCVSVIGVLDLSGNGPVPGVLKISMTLLTGDAGLEAMRKAEAHPKATEGAVAIKANGDVSSIISDLPRPREG